MLRSHWHARFPDTWQVSANLTSRHASCMEIIKACLGSTPTHLCAFVERNRTDRARCSLFARVLAPTVFDRHLGLRSTITQRRPLISSTRTSLTAHDWSCNQEHPNHHFADCRQGCLCLQMSPAGWVRVKQTGRGNVLRFEQV